MTNLDSITVNRNPVSDNELANEKHIDDELDKNKIVRFNQTLENYLKVSVGNIINNPTENNKIQITGTTKINYPNIGGYLLQNRNKKSGEKNGNGKLKNFIRSTKTNSPSPHSGAESLPPIGNAFMYTETSSNKHGDGVFVILERTDIIQITNITFYYNRFSILTDDSLKAIGRFRIQLLLDDDTWSTQKTFAKNTQYSENPTDWTLLKISFTVENYGIRLCLDEIHSAHSDMCFSNVTILHSVF